jgi:predicted transposase YbfD/YdcC
MPALPSSLISSLSCAPALTVPETVGGLPAALAGLPDPRARRGVRHRLPVVVSAAVCAVVAGYRSYTAIAEWVADAPDTTVRVLDIAPDRRPSETMIRRVLQALDPQLLTAAIGVGLAGRVTAGAVSGRRAIAVDGKTNEITRFGPLLDQIGDLRDTVITADALHCQREHVTYLAERGAHSDPDHQRQPTPPACPARRPALTGSPGRHPRHRPRPRPPRDPHPQNSDHRVRHRLPARRAGHPDPPPQTPSRPAEALHHRNGLRHHRPARPPGETRATGCLDPRALAHREQDSLGPRCHLR